MGRRRKTLERVDSEMDMTPMIDCVFLLIIFFMIVTELKKNDSVILKLPDAASAVVDEESKLIINIQEDGTITVASKTRTDNQLVSFLNSFYLRHKSEDLEPADKYSKKLIKLRVDEKAEFRDVQKVLTILVEQKFYKIAFGANHNENVK